MSQEFRDSRGRPIRRGDRVMFRGEVYTVADFMPGLGRFGSAVVEFKEPDVHTDEVADELSVDKVDE